TFPEAVPSGRNRKRAACGYDGTTPPSPGGSPKEVYACLYDLSSLCWRLRPPLWLGHGLRTVPLGPTEGLPLCQEETCGRGRGQADEITRPASGIRQAENVTLRPDSPTFHW